MNDESSPGRDTLQAKPECSWVPLDSPQRCFNNMYGAQSRPWQVNEWKDERMVVPGSLKNILSGSKMKEQRVKVLGSEKAGVEFCLHC